jgi:glycosyltransferase involved in cell wall biosynthesis
MSLVSVSQSASSSARAVSVGMPVYNAAAWIESALDSLLAQTFADFELIVSDNASTDATYAICQRYAQQDRRIRLLRNPANIGANRNYVAVLQAASGKYFKWASSNDLCLPTFIERCVAALESDPKAVLACPRSALFVESMEDAAPYDRDLELLQNDPADRFIGMHASMGLNNSFNGVIRRDALLRVSPMGSYIGADIVLMAELALLGKFLLLDERLFFRRMSPEAATRLKSHREVERHLVPSARGPLKWQEWRFQFARLRACRHAKFPSSAWLRAVSYSLRSFVWARRELLGEITAGLRPGNEFERVS